MRIDEWRRDKLATCVDHLGRIALHVLTNRGDVAVLDRNVHRASPVRQNCLFDQQIKHNPHQVVSAHDTRGAAFSKAFIKTWRTESGIDQIPA